MAPAANRHSTPRFPTLHALETQSADIVVIAQPITHTHTVDALETRKIPTNSPIRADQLTTTIETDLPYQEHTCDRRSVCSPQESDNEASTQLRIHGSSEDTHLARIANHDDNTHTGTRKIPRQPRALHMLFPLQDTFTSPTHQIFSSTPSASTPSTIPPSSRRSIFPRASPPTFLCPSAIIPHQHASQHYRTLQTGSTTGTRPYTTGFVARMDYEFTYLPVGFKILLFTCMALGFLWAIIVWLVNFPPIRKKSASSTTKLNRRKCRRGEGGWFSWCTPKWLLRWIWKHDHKKPIDKPTKYAPLPSADDSSALASGSSMATSRASWIEPRLRNRIINGRDDDMKDAEEAIELTRRNPKRKISEPDTPLLPPWSATNTTPENRLRKNGASKARAVHSRSASMSSIAAVAPPIEARNIGLEDRQTSPSNPYIPAPQVRPRSSSEWLAAREAFFSSQNAHRYSSSHLFSPGTSAHASDYSFDNFEALEAQTTPPKRLSRVCDKGNSNGSWLDLGLEFVDGAVNRAADTVAKWTNDNSDNEGLLLPVAKEEIN